MARIAWDYVLTPTAPSSQLPLFTVPGGRTIFLNQFFPARIHHVWAIFSISLTAISVRKGVAEHFGITAIQSAGHSTITNPRTQVYSKIIPQPIGFFQHHPAGR